MTSEAKSGGRTPSFSSAELERLWEEACQRAASYLGIRRAVLREDIEEVRREFATLVAAAECEACAKICDVAAKASFGDPSLCAAAIRMRFNAEVSGAGNKDRID